MASRLCLVLIGALMGACTGGELRGSDQPDPDRIRELEQKVTAQAVEILRLKLELAEARKDDARRRELLESGLGSEIDAVRIFTLNRLQSEPEESASQFIDTARVMLAAGGSAPVRARIVEFLCRFPRCRESVFAAAADRDPLVRAASAAGLRRYPGDDTLGILQTLLKDSEPAVRLATVETLGLFRHSDSGSVLLEALRAGQADTVLERGLKVLGKLRVPEAFELFLRHLGHDADAVRWASIQGLGALGDPRAIEHVRPFLSDDQPRSLREIAIHTLGRLKDAASVPVLLKILKQDKNENLRTAACDALGQIGDERAVAPLLNVFEEDSAAAVQTRAWEATVAIVEGNAERQAALVKQLVVRKRKTEAQEIFQKLAATHDGEEHAARVRSLEGLLALFLMEEGDHGRAMEHLKRLTAAEADTRYSRMLGICYREVGDTDTALKTFREALAAAPQGDPAVADLRIEVLATIIVREEYATALAETVALAKELKLAEAHRRRLATLVHTTVRALLTRASAKEEATRKAAFDILVANGRITVWSILSSVDDRDLRPAMISVCNRVTGSKVEAAAAADEEAFGTAVTEWSAWSGQNPW